MSAEEDDVFKEHVKKIFGGRAEDFSSDLMDFLRRLWHEGCERGSFFGKILGRDEGREEGYREGHAAGFEDGQAVGQQQLAVLFSGVVRGRKVNDVFLPSFLQELPPHMAASLNLVLQPWVMEAWQRILDAPDLEAAARALDPAPNLPLRDRLFSDPAFASIVRPSVILEEKP